MKRELRTLLIWATLFLSTAPAFGACLALDEARKQVADVPGAALTEISGPNLAMAIELFNTFAPDDEQATDTAVLIDLPDGGGFLAAGKNGEICGMVRFRPDRWRALRVSILGRDA